MNVSSTRARVQEAKRGSANGRFVGHSVILACIRSGKQWEADHRGDSETPRSPRIDDRRNNVNRVYAWASKRIIDRYDVSTSVAIMARKKLVRDDKITLSRYETNNATFRPLSLKGSNKPGQTSRDARWSHFDEGTDRTVDRESRVDQPHWREPRTPKTSRWPLTWSAVAVDASATARSTRNTRDLAQKPGDRLFTLVCRPRLLRAAEFLN